MLQASVLMASVEDISHPDEWSIAEFPDVRFRDDGTAICTLSTSGLRNDPQFRERRLARKMGRTMTAAMVSAFACELAMKAISLTSKDEAVKSHDLDTLYADLPEQSRLRIVADYPISSVYSKLAGMRLALGANLKPALAKQRRRR